MTTLWNGWTGYFLTGTLAIVLSWVASGCRFGNRTELAENPDKWSGYYQSQPQSLQFCVSLSSSSSSSCGSAPTNQIPSLLSIAITNPLAFLVNDLNTGDSFIFDPYGQGEALQIFIDTNSLALGFLGSSSPVTLWNDPACTSQLYLDMEGSLVMGSIVSFGGVNTQGRVELDVEASTVYDGPCTASFQELSDCYQDANQCGGSSSSENQTLQQSVQALFDPYINQAQVMTASDIPNVTGMGYTVSYR